MSVTIAQVIFLVVAIALGVIILLQQSKGAGMGASFGSGASGTVFGAKGSGSFLYKMTRVLAALFFISALSLGYLQNRTINQDSIFVNNAASEKKVEATVDVPPPSTDNSAPASNTEVPGPAPSLPAEQK